MNWMAEFGRRTAMLVRGRKFEREIEEEIRAHVERREQELQESGVSGRPLVPAEAHTEARKQFGNALALREESREAWGWAWLEHLAQDLRFAFRMFGKNPGFTAIAVLTLALGIGANTAIFSVVYAVLLRPLPYKNPSRLVVLNETTPKVGVVSVSYPNFLDWRAESHTFSQMAAVHSVDFSLAGDVSQPEDISGYAVSPNFLSMMGYQPLLGRDFQVSEEKSGTAPVLMISYPLWQSHFGGARNVIGRTITLDGRGFSIIGVLPPNFLAMDRTDVLLPIGDWITQNSGEAASRADRGDMVVIGRLAPGATFTQAQTEMRSIAARLAKEYPLSNDRFGVALKPIRDAFAGEVRPAMLVLFVAVFFVLLIACANVANLFLVRGAARGKEIALRLAFGASRRRIVRQMLTESLALALLGGAIGLGLAFAGIRGILQLIPADLLSGAKVDVNGAVLLFTAIAVTFAALLFGLAPAAQITKRDVQEKLKEGARTASAGSGQNRLRGLLAVVEISLAVILLAGAGLMMKSLFRLLQVNPGFRPAHVLKMEMDLRTQQYANDPALLNFWQRVLDGVRLLPGVQSAAVGTVIPMAHEHSRADITIEGMAAPRPGNWPHPDYHKVSPDFLETMGIPLLRGRSFAESDRQKSQLVGMVNERLARQYWRGENPIGKRFMFGHFDPNAKNPPEWITVVGVVGDLKLYGLANPSRLEVYVPALQFPSSDMNLMVKSAVEPAALTSAIRSVVASIDKNQPIFAIHTMTQLVSDSVATRRLTLVLLGLFSGLALVLAAIGIYGVISYSVAQRTHEIGIRMALGAQRGGVVRMVLGQGGKLALAGIVIGIVAAFGLTRLMTSLLYGVSATDPLTFAGVALLLFGVALVACYVPARRAMKVDPMVALRYE